MRETEFAIVGAGPAGLAAALTAADAGAHLTIFDEQPSPGGQIFRQPPATFREEGADRRPGHALRMAALAHPRIRFELGTTVWGILDDRSLAYSSAAGGGRLRARQVLLAPGCYDLPVAFPGWTLPGVMSAGGIQTMVKSQHLLPGRRFLLAGAHPLLLLVAAQLLKAGAQLEAVVFAQQLDLWEGIAQLPRLWGHWSKLAEAMACWRTLRTHGVPIRFGQVIVRAEGGEEVERAVLARANRDWSPRPGTEYTVPVDTIGIGYGFVPSTELAAQAGAAMRWEPGQGVWVVEHDQAMRTSLPGLLVAGEATGVAGADVAIEEGRLAGLTAAEALGYLSPAEAEHRRKAVTSSLSRQQRFASVLDRLCAPRPGLFRLVTEQTTVCRCECLTAGAVQQALADHPHLRTTDSVKLLTRAGMGLCQGRYCGRTVAHLVAEATAQPPTAVGAYRVRPPVKPIPIAHLLGERDL